MSGEAPNPRLEDTLPHDIDGTDLDRTTESPVVEGGEFNEDQTIFSGLKTYFQEVRIGHAANTRARLHQEHQRRQVYMRHVEERLKPIEIKKKKREDPSYKPSREERLHLNIPEKDLPAASSRHERRHQRKINKRIAKVYQTEKKLNNLDTSLGVGKGAVPYWRTLVARADMRAANNVALRKGEITSSQHLENARSVRRHSELRDSFPQYTTKALLAWRTARAKREARQPIRNAIRNFRWNHANLVAGDHHPTNPKYLPPPPESPDPVEMPPRPIVTRHKPGEMLGKETHPRSPRMSERIVGTAEADSTRRYRKRYKPAKALSEEDLINLAERNMTDEEKAARRPSAEQYKAWERELTPHHVMIIKQRTDFMTQLDKLVEDEADRIRNSGIVVTPENIDNHLKKAREKFQYQLLRHNLYKILEVEEVPGSSKAEAPLLRKLYDLMSMDEPAFKALQKIDPSNILQPENIGFLRIFAEDLINHRVEEGANRKTATGEIFRQYIWSHLTKSDGSLDKEAYEKFKKAFAATPEDKTTTTSEPNSAKEAGTRDFSDLNDEQKEYIARRIREAKAHGGMTLNDMLNLIYNVRAGFYGQSEQNFFYDRGTTSGHKGPEGFHERTYAKANQEAEMKRVQMEMGVVSDIETAYEQLIEQGLSPKKAWAKIVSEQHARNDNPNAGDEEREALRYAAKRLTEARNQAKAQKAAETAETQTEPSPIRDAAEETTTEPAQSPETTETDEIIAEQDIADQSAEAWAEHEDIKPQDAPKSNSKKRTTRNRFGGTPPNY